MPLCRQHFQTHFLEWKLMYFDWNFIEICSKGPFNNISVYWFRYKGLALVRRKKIIWTNDGVVYWCIYASLVLNDLTHKQLEFHTWVLSTVAADGLVLQHQAISTHSADQILYWTSVWQKNYNYYEKKTQKIWLKILKIWPRYLLVQMYWFTWKFLMTWT